MPSSVTSRRASPASGSGSRRARDPRVGLRRRPVERRLPPPHGSRHRGRGRAVLRGARDLRRRAGVGAVPIDRVRRAAVGSADRGRRTARPPARRLSGDRLAPARGGYRSWGADITPDDSARAGLASRWRSTRTPTSSARRGATAPRRRRHPPPPMPDARGCSFVHPGERTGARRRRDRRTVTSGGIGYRVEESIAFAYLPDELDEVGTKVSIEVFGVGRRGGRRGHALGPFRREDQGVMEQPSFDLDGQVALVTGAGRGIGRDLVLALAAAGGRVAAGVRSPGDGEWWSTGRVTPAATPRRSRSTSPTAARSSAPWRRPSDGSAGSTSW